MASKRRAPAGKTRKKKPETGGHAKGKGNGNGNGNGSKRLLLQVLKLGETPRPRLTYQQYMKSCGKKSCKLCRGVEQAHGPYWRRIAWDADRRKTLVTQLGTDLPEDILQVWIHQESAWDPDFRRRSLQAEQAVFRVDSLLRQLQSERTRAARAEDGIDRLRAFIISLQVQIRDLEDQLDLYQSGVIRHERPTALVELTRIYRRIAGKYHPDRNRQKVDPQEVMKDINELFQALKAPRR